MRVDNASGGMCALSQASLSNITIYLHRISADTKEMTRLAVNDDYLTEAAATNIMQISSVAESGAKILAQFLAPEKADNPAVNSSIDGQRCLGTMLAEILLGIGEGTRLVSLLQLGVSEHIFSKELALCRKNLVVHSSGLYKLCCGMICPKLVEVGTSECIRESCLAKKLSLSLRKGTQFTPRATRLNRVKSF